MSQRIQIPGNRFITFPDDIPDEEMLRQIEEILLLPEDEQEIVIATLEGREPSFVSGELQDLIDSGKVDTNNIKALHQGGSFQGLEFAKKMLGTTGSLASFGFGLSGLPLWLRTALVGGGGALQSIARDKNPLGGAAFESGLELISHGIGKTIPEAATRMGLRFGGMPQQAAEEAAEAFARERATTRRNAPGSLFKAVTRFARGDLSGARDATRDARTLFPASTARTTERRGRLGRQVEEVETSAPLNEVFFEIDDIQGATAGAQRRALTGSRAVDEREKIKQIESDYIDQQRLARGADDVAQGRAFEGQRNPAQPHVPPGEPINVTPGVAGARRILPRNPVPGQRGPRELPGQVEGASSPFDDLNFGFGPRPAGRRNSVDSLGRTLRHNLSFRELSENMRARRQAAQAVRNREQAGTLNPGLSSDAAQGPAQKALGEREYRMREGALDLAFTPEEAGPIRNLSQRLTDLFTMEGAQKAIGSAGGVITNPAKAAVRGGLTGGAVASLAGLLGVDFQTAMALGAMGSLGGPVIFAPSGLSRVGSAVDTTTQGLNAFRRGRNVQESFEDLFAPEEPLPTPVRRRRF